MSSTSDAPLVVYSQRMTLNFYSRDLFMMRRVLARLSAYIYHAIWLLSISTKDPTPVIITLFRSTPLLSIKSEVDRIVKHFQISFNVEVDVTGAEDSKFDTMMKLDPKSVNQYGTLPLGFELDTSLDFYSRKRRHLSVDKSSFPVVDDLFVSRMYERFKASNSSGISFDDFKLVVKYSLGALMSMFD